MARRLVLHIGAMKSGTSFLQNVMLENPQEMRRQGLLFPGRKWGQQVNAVYELIDHGGPAQRPVPADGAFARLAAEIDAFEGTAVWSMEFLAPRGRRKIELLLARFPDTVVDVVLTGRDLTRTLPAMWQESVQNGGVQTWEGYLGHVRAEHKRRDGPGKRFWSHQELAAIAERWSGVVGRDRFTLVTVPPPGAPQRLLWERFAGVLGADPAPFDLDVLRNPSIGPASAMVLRALNEALADDPLPVAAYNRLVKRLLAKEVLAARGRAEPGLGVDQPWVLERGAEEVRRLRALDLRVVGDLEELMPRPVSGIGVDGITVEGQLDAAVDGLVGLLRHVQRVRARAAGRR